MVERFGKALRKGGEVNDGVEGEEVGEFNVAHVDLEAGD